MAVTESQGMGEALNCCRHGYPLRFETYGDHVLNSINLHRDCDGCDSFKRNGNDPYPWVGYKVSACFLLRLIFCPKCFKSVCYWRLYHPLQQVASRESVLEASKTSTMWFVIICRGLASATFTYMQIDVANTRFSCAESVGGWGSETPSKLVIGLMQLCEAISQRVV